MDERIYLINVLDFGAKGDGVTDDTDAIQKAINACDPDLVVESTLAPIIDDPAHLLTAVEPPQSPLSSP